MARSMASRASGSSTPASSKSTRPGCTTATQNSGLPLPEPMRVSAGFWVTGLSGKTRIQTLPPRLTWRVMAIRAASIWRAVSQPGSVAWMPKSPNCTEVPPLAAPVRRPRWVLRCLTFLGISMSIRLLAEVRCLVMLVAGLPLHLLVLGQLALQFVGLRQQIAHCPCLLVLLLAGAVGGGDGSLLLRLLRVLLARGEALGPAAATARSDEATRAALPRRLAHGHGGLAGDLVLDGDLVGQ